MEYLNILHLSDLHIGNFKYEDPETLAINIKNILEDYNRPVDIVIFSGDVFDGRSLTKLDDIENAVVFFDAIIKYINEAKIGDNILTKDDILFVPGNHDLMRNDTNQYSKYDDFLKAFYPKGKSSNVTVVDNYNFICEFTEKKIAILGFNSCKVKAETVKENDLKWIKNLDLPSTLGDLNAIRKAIRQDREKDAKWDDYGYIEPRELNNVFSTFKNLHQNFNDYNILAVFHHHFYPFPEISSGKPDASFIRNYTDVMNQFQRHGVKLVLHGHKHLSIHRVITDQRYFEDPESVVYVLSAGSVGCKDVFNPSFQWLRFFNRNHTRLAEVEKYDYKDQQLETVKKFVIPPQKVEEKANSINLIENLASDEPKLHKEYERLTNLFEQIIIDNKISHLIDVIGRLLTIFNDIKTELRNKPLINYLLLLTLNYRTIFLRNHYSNDEKNDEILQKLEAAFRKHLESFYADNLIDFLKAIHKEDLDSKYTAIIKNVSSSNKKVGAYCSIALFLVDLFLNISDYGEYYFAEEKLTHKINIKLNKGVFYNAIPSDSLSIEGDIERRAITMNFKSKNPTAHKVAVLIVKDFEMRLNKFEDSLKEIKLKLYYITPKVKVDNYDLENFHFDAYIPTLLPLLTGDNLYRSKEVFIRELVQNAIDATLFRQQLQPNQKFDPQIKIELGTVVREGNKVKFFRIIDKGTGMSRFTIERYFTSIGRSFYVSDEFDEIKRDKSIHYSAISNFGIGFLSCFMVCKEILVSTKNIMHEDGDKGLEIEIPNYDGCFFIRKIETATYGTEITLFEDDRKLFDTKKFVSYMKETFVGLPISIHIKKPSGKKNDLLIEAFSKQREMHASAKSGANFMFFVPFSEKNKSVDSIAWKDYINQDDSELNPFGIWVDFEGISESHEKNQISVSNQGLKVSTPFVPIKLDVNKYSPKIHVNFPSSFIQLDVARETILNVNKQIDFSPFYTALKNQMLGFLEACRSSKQPLNIYKLNIVQTHLRLLNQTLFAIADWPLVFILTIEISRDEFTFKLIERSDIIEGYNKSKVLYFDIFDNQRMHDVFSFMQTIKIKSTGLKKALVDLKEANNLKAFEKEHDFLEYDPNYDNHFHHRYGISARSLSQEFIKDDNQKEFWRTFEYDYANQYRYYSRIMNKLDEKSLRGIFLSTYYRHSHITKTAFGDMFLEALLSLKNIAFSTYSTTDYKLFTLKIKRADLGLEVPLNNS